MNIFHLRDLKLSEYSIHIIGMKTSLRFYFTVHFTALLRILHEINSQSTNDKANGHHLFIPFLLQRYAQRTRLLYRIT